MTVQVTITDVSDRSGNMGRSMYTCKASTGGIGEFSTEQLLKGYEVLERYRDHFDQNRAVFEGRTWHIYAGEAPYDPGNVDTGLKIFDEQANRSGGFMTGNVFSSVQSSSFIRPYSETRCNDFDFAPGELREADLKYFSRVAYFQPGLKRFLDVVNSPANLNKDLVGYKVVHTPGRRLNAHEPDVHLHGWVVTERNGKLIEVVHDNTPTSFNVMDRAVAAFTMKTLATPKPLIKIDEGKLTFTATELELFYSLRQGSQMPSLENIQVAQNIKSAPQRRPRP